MSLLLGSPIIWILVVLVGCFSQTMGAGDTWGYSENNGPAHWYNSYSICGADSQSPIDISTKDTVYQEITAINYENYDQPTTTATIRDTGYALQVDFAPSDQYTINGGGLGTGNSYQLAQFHFHVGADGTKGSEHTIDGKKYPLEMHLVHYRTDLGNLTHAADKDRGLAVLGIMFEVGDVENEHFAVITSAISEVLTPGSAPATIPSLNILSLLPSDRSKFYRYSGSLTTPPCYESVIWTVFQQTVHISQAQLAAFRTPFFDQDQQHALQDNYRPPQPLNSRRVMSNDPAAKDNNPSTAPPAYTPHTLLMASLMVAVLNTVALMTGRFL